MTAPNVGFAAKLFSSGDPLEGGLLDPTAANRLGQRSLFDAGIAMLGASGPAPVTPHLGGVLAAGLQAGRQSFGSGLERQLAAGQVMDERQMKARRDAVMQKYSGKNDIMSMIGMLNELLAIGDYKGATPLAGFLSNYVNQMGGGGDASGIVYRNSPDGSELLGISKATGEVVTRTKLGEPRPNPFEQLTAAQERARADSQRDYVARTQNMLLDNYKSQMGPVRDTYDTIVRALALAPRALDPKDPSGMARNQLIVAFVKSIDPGSVAREGEVSLAARLTGLQSQAEGYIDAATGKVSPAIPAGLVRDIVNTLAENAGFFHKKLTDAGARYGRWGRSLGVDTEPLGFEPPPAPAFGDAAAAERFGQAISGGR